MYKLKNVYNAVLQVNLQFIFIKKYFNINNTKSYILKRLNSWMRQMIEGLAKLQTWTPYSYGQYGTMMVLYRSIFNLILRLKFKKYRKKWNVILIIFLLFLRSKLQVRHLLSIVLIYLLLCFVGERNGYIF